MAAGARGSNRSGPRSAVGRAPERGAVLVEFAIVGTLLFTLIFGIIDYGFMVNRDTLVSNAAREGAREGALNPVSAAVESVVRSDLADLDQSALTVAVSCRKPDGSACADFDADAESGGVVIVDVSYTHNWLTFIPRTAFGDTIELQKQIEMRIE